ncbi:MAG: M23 family metallopeptidase [Flavobacteriaceae bacterium]|nr:M23 family metallopeptidase [Flavobacteriaceae bacterium]
MKYIIICILFLCPAKNYAQIDFKTYYERVDNENILFADNNELCPVTYKFSLVLKNYKSSKGKEVEIVIPAKTKKFEILKLSRINPKKATSYKTKNGFLNLGNHLVEKHDDSYQYQLPFKKGAAFKIGQGYNGTISHHNKKALDFNMPIGTKICAIRDGIVVRVVETNYRGCAKRECMKFNNKVIIYHSDGSFVEYTHIKKNGAIVTVGDTVKAGQEIALSGNTGWSTGPHLHLVVFYQKMKKRKTIATNFLTNDGKQQEVLSAKKTYSKNY